MPKPDSTPYPLYLLPCLWGLDVLAALLSWGCLIAHAWGAVALPFHLWAVVLLFVWVVLMQQRVLAAANGHNIPFADFYCRYKGCILLLCWAVAAVEIWLLLCSVSTQFLWYAVISFFLLVLGRLPLLNRWVLFTSACSAAAFTAACAIPAYCYDLMLSPYHLVVDSSLWWLAAAFCLFIFSRALTPSMFIPPIMQWVLTLVMFVCCSQKVMGVTENMQGFYLALCIFSFVLFVWYRLRSDISEEAWYALSWPLIALPPLISFCF